MTIPSLLVETHLVQILNGKVTVDVTDEQAAKAARKGLELPSCTLAAP